VLSASRHDDDIALAARPLFAAEEEFHLALEQPHDLLICVTAAQQSFGLGSSREREEAAVHWGIVP
jgi:3-isopropylmalate dehydratase small subunit